VRVDFSKVHICLNDDDDDRDQQSINGLSHMSRNRRLGARYKSFPRSFAPLKPTEPPRIRSTHNAHVPIVSGLDWPCAPWTHTGPVRLWTDRDALREAVVVSCRPVSGLCLVTLRSLEKGLFASWAFQKSLYQPRPGHPDGHCLSQVIYPCPSLSFHAGFRPVWIFIFFLGLA
jgi:hypothetical protein